MAESIVAAVDFSDVTPCVLERAAKEVKLRPGATLHLIHVVPAPVAPAGAFMPHLAIDMTQALEETREELLRVARAAGLGTLSVVGHVRIGAALQEIAALADEVGADLIVVGASSKGLAMRALLGSTAYSLVRQAPCSVLIARPASVPEIQPRRADQEDDVHKRHHPLAHTHYASRENDPVGSLSFRLPE